MTESQSPRATVVITTKNRKEELRRALESAFAQSAPIEVLVIDDGSTDGTTEMVQAEFPRARVERFDKSRGLVVQRNHAARIASAPILFSIDDDAAFSTPGVIEQTLAEFEDSRVGAVAIPYIEPNRDSRVMQKAPNCLGTWVTDTFIGTAHAVRRDLFLRLGGYREALVHQGEERDFCLRMLNTGYVVRLGNADLIEHYESPRRDLRRMDFYGTRNSVLFAWQNVPMSVLPLYLVATSAKCILWTFAPKRLVVRIAGLSTGYRMMSQSERLPVSRTAYRLMRDLRHGGPRRLDEIRTQLDA